MNKSLQSKSSICAWLFRQGKEACETSFEPDMDLAYEMFDRKIRVQDLVDELRLYHTVIGYAMSADISRFLEDFVIARPPLQPSPFAVAPSLPDSTA